MERRREWRVWREVRRWWRKEGVVGGGRRQERERVGESDVRREEEEEEEEGGGEDEHNEEEATSVRPLYSSTSSSVIGVILTNTGLPSLSPSRGYVAEGFRAAVPSSEGMTARRVEKR